MKKDNKWLKGKVEKQDTTSDLVYDMSHRYSTAFRISEGEEDYTWNEDCVFCPWCGHWKEDTNLSFYKSKKGLAECEDCGKVFYFTSGIKYSTVRTEV